VFLLDFYQGIGGPLTCLFVYKSAKNILSILHHWIVAGQDKFSCQISLNQNQNGKNATSPSNGIYKLLNWQFCQHFQTILKKTTVQQPNGCKNYSITSREQDGLTSKQSLTSEMHLEVGS
jgi:hypothetical protein